MSAPRVTVRAHVPWYWRALLTVIMLVAAMVLTNWVYDFGRRYAGFDKSLSDQELNSLRERVETLETEAQRLRGIGNASEASLQIERTAQQNLSEQVKRLEDENGRLREDLAAFENLASGEAKNEALGIHRLQVEPDPANPGTFRYRMLLAAPVARPEREFRGSLILLATVQQEGKTVIVNILDTAPAEAQKAQLSFKYFRRVEGSFKLPPNGVLKKIEVRLMQGAAVVASQQVTM
jgi:uncharacterized protein (UPF0335 family)